MKILCSGDGRAVKIIRKDASGSPGSLRLSQFVYPFETGDRVLLRNTLTKQVCELSGEEWRAVCAGQPPQRLRDELTRLCFLVEPDEDEFSRYETVFSLLRIMEKKTRGIRSYTILPTTGCNARCVYCYEEGWQTQSMDTVTADAVADFICRTKQEGKIRLDWFGGEPLCGAGTISRICEKLREQGVEYESIIITNGTLLTPALAVTASELWHLKSAQISMDGAREDYERRKRYVQPKLCNYATAMDAVELLADAGVRVRLRCNYDAENLPRVRAFFDDCKVRFGERKNISYYLEQLFCASGEEESAALFRAAAEAASYLDELNLASAEKLKCRLKTHYCMADSGGQSVIIDPLGGLHTCEHDIQGKPFGTISDTSLSWPDTRAVTASECRTCCFLPDCTPFRKDQCLLKIAACKAQAAVHTERALIALIKQKNGAEEDENGEDQDVIC